MIADKSAGARNRGLQTRVSKCKFRVCSRSIIRWVNMCLRGRRIGWHALNARYEFFNLPPTRISPLSVKM